MLPWPGCWVFLKHHGFLKTSKKTHRFRSINNKRARHWQHDKILHYYNMINKTIINYYSYVDNRARIGDIVRHLMRDSCALTLKLKQHAADHMGTIYKKYGKRLKCPNTGYEYYIPQEAMHRTGHYQVDANPAFPEKLMVKRTVRERKKRVT